MKCMIQERKEIIPDEEHKVWAENQVGNIKRLSEKCLGERKEIFYREKTERNEEKIMLRLYTKNTKLDGLSSTNSRQIYLSRCYQELSTAKKSRWIKQLSSIY